MSSPVPPSLSSNLLKDPTRTQPPARKNGMASSIHIGRGPLQCPCCDFRADEKDKITKYMALCSKDKLIDGEAETEVKSDKDEITIVEEINGAKKETDEKRS